MSDKIKKLLIFAIVTIICLVFMKMAGTILSIIFALGACLAAFLFIKKLITKEEK